ncbi:MAG: hypothetical protein VYE68_02485 [Acidobacteriota bacterium]|nr:hypothetical protein [Acidobacteriota bacterium]
MAQGADNEIDLFMERVLDNRDASWRRLGDFILRETETLEFAAPLGLALAGFHHEYEWYVRDEVVVRSPIRFDGVDIDEETRREYEADWLREERRRRGRRDTRRRAMSRRDTKDNVTIAIERQWGVEVSEDLRERIAADADLIGNDLAAITLNTGAILEEAGGVTALGFGDTVARTRDLFVMLDTDQLTPNEVVRALGRPLVHLVDGLDQAGDDELDAFVELWELAVQFELAAPEVVSYASRARAALASRPDQTPAVKLQALETQLVALGGTIPPTDGPEDLRLADAARLEPRFVSEAYFMEFRFEPGNYYLVGRDTLAGREVVKIEYYPTKLFDTVDAADGRDRQLERGFNKTSLVTLWIDPVLHQIVRYTFENAGLDFLPGRWLVRVDELQASMQMGQPIGGVWLPQRVTVSGRATVALGAFDIQFIREYSDYREADTGGRLVGVEPLR